MFKAPYFNLPQKHEGRVVTSSVLEHHLEKSSAHLVRRAGMLCEGVCVLPTSPLWDDCARFISEREKKMRTQLETKYGVKLIPSPQAEGNG